ncbi:transcriptional regulator [Erythrobacter sp. SD-21]|uniref:winged helix-turn-helix domain-containing protein n=1 Tax=Erythrobacter sp. SD-21 TaxID=161528 RepID=UPI000153EF52|nr:transcriptional regulator [Erythrobacter sp. SD-21]EDL49486.1 transcription activator ToxR [Erythrobacter sp. SD-21]
MGETTGLVRFGDFTLDLHGRRLLRGGEAVELGSRYFDALVLLATHPGELISKTRFMDDVWRGIPVTDEALTQAIRTLRRALGDEASAPRYIETVPKHGYRFIAELDDAPPASPPPHAPSQSHAARLAGATTLGGLAAGILGGFFYGILGTDGSAGGFVTILLLTIALAVLGGAGIGAGMALTASWRIRSGWALVAGGGAGGVVIGGLGSALAVYGLQALTGATPPPVTGMFEGLALGVAASCALVLALQLDLDRFAAGLLASAVGALVAGLTAFWGGRFYGSTLVMLEEEFPLSRLDMAGVASLFREDGFYMISQFGTAMLEGAVFASALVIANLRWRVDRA